MGCGGLEELGRICIPFAKLCDDIERAPVGLSLMELRQKVLLAV